MTSNFVRFNRLFVHKWQQNLLKFANVLVILKKLTDALIVRQSLDLGQEASITKDMQSKYSI